MFQGKTGRTAAGPPGSVGPGRLAHPAPWAGPVPFTVYPLYFAFLAHEKKLAQ
jgi:hypothetical protein